MRSDRYILSIVVVAVLVGTLFFSDASITGYVPTEVESQSLNINVFESQRFELRSLSSSLSSLAISGEIKGEGLANVYLTDNKNRLLVYSNKRKRGSSMEQITGMYSLEVKPGQTLNAIESLPEGYETSSGPFSSQCQETCVIDEDLFVGKSLFLDVIVEPGTSIHIEEVHFAR